MNCCGNCGSTRNLYYTDPQKGTDTRTYKKPHVRCRDCYETEFHRARHEGIEEYRKEGSSEQS